MSKAKTTSSSKTMDEVRDEISTDVVDELLSQYWMQALIEQETTRRLSGGKGSVLCTRMQEALCS